MKTVRNVRKLITSVSIPVISTFFKLLGYMNQFAHDFSCKMGLILTMPVSSISNLIQFLDAEML